MSERNLDSTKRFVPSGVDAQSWIGFEHRIQERRFKALVEAVASAVARRDGVAARLALEEARELRPTAPELDAWSARVAQLPVAIPSTAASGYAWYRALGAVAMFAVGIGLVMGIEHLRPGTTEQIATSDVASTPEALRAEASPAPVDPVIAPSAGRESEAVPLAEFGSATSPGATAPSAIEPAPSSNAPVVTVPNTRPVVASGRLREEPVGTAGAPRAAAADVRRADVPDRPAVRPLADTVRAANTNTERAAEPTFDANREVPDDYVAPAPRPENRPASTDVRLPNPAIGANSGPAIVANVAPQPVSVMPPPPALTATTAGATASTVTPRGDDSRVAQVLNQYARAYNRLDPAAARDVWPTVDGRALTRAFASLESQDVSFDRCDIDVKGNQASASCRGTASYVGKIGSRQARTEPRQWNFELKLHGDDWKIEKAQAIAR